MFWEKPEILCCGIKNSKSFCLHQKTTTGGFGGFFVLVSEEYGDAVYTSYDFICQYQRLRLNKIKSLVPEELYPYTDVVTLVEINI